MPDSVFEEKGKLLTKGLQNTLALRVVTSILCFLVVPIIVLSFLLYNREYQQRKEANLFALDLIAHEMRDVVASFIQQNETVSESLAYVITMPGRYSPTAENTSLNALFSKLSSNAIVSDIVYVDTKAIDDVCTIASNPLFLGKNMKEVLAKVSFDGAKNLLFAYQFPKAQTATLMTAHPIYTPGTQTVQGVILVFITPSLFQSKISFATNNQFPISTSVLTDFGLVVASTRSDLLNTRFTLKGHLLPPKLYGQKAASPLIELTPLAAYADSFGFTFEGDQRIAAYLPLGAVKHGILVEMSDSVNLSNIGTFLLRMLVIFALVIVTGIIGTVWLTFRLSRPLKTLCGCMLSAQRGNRSHRYEKDRWGFELNVVGTIFNQMLDAFEQQLEEIKKERGAKEVLEQELLVGQRIQKSLLPSSLPEVPSLEIATGFESAREVGGDFYDVIVREREGKQEVLISIADASGKGVSACLYSLSVRSMVRTAFYHNHPLDEIVKDANELLLVDTEETSAFVTLWVGILTVDTGALQFVNCGHHPAYHLLQDGGMAKLHTQNIALGAISLDTVEMQTTVLNKGEGLFLFTDGVVEAHNEQGMLFGEDRLTELLAKPDTHPQETVDQLFAAVHEYAHGVEQYDDITMLSVRRQS